MHPWADFHPKVVVLRLSQDRDLSVVNKMSKLNMKLYTSPIKSRCTHDKTHYNKCNGNIDKKLFRKGQPAFNMQHASQNKAKHLPRQEQAGLTANQHSRCHSRHRVWRIAQVQHVSRHLVQAVHRIFKHEGHRHIGHLEDKWEKTKGWCERAKYFDKFLSAAMGWTPAPRGIALTEGWACTPADTSENESLDAFANGIEMVIKAN